MGGRAYFRGADSPLKGDTVTLTQEDQHEEQPPHALRGIFRD